LIVSSDLSGNISQLLPYYLGSLSGTLRSEWSDPAAKSLSAS